MRSIVILLNIKAKDATRKDEIESYIQSHSRADISLSLHVLEPHEDVEQTAKEYIKNGIDTLVAAGGDGTIHAVAKALLGQSATLGILPVGTLNHLAKDLQIPLNVTQALDLIIQNTTTLQIDVGSCNEEFFLNNSSIGVYPRIVGMREWYQEHGHIKWSALFFSFMYVLRRLPLMKVKLTFNGQVIEKKCSFVFVGNNIYDLGGLKTGTRQSLTDGKLSLWISHSTSRIGLLHLFFRAFLGNIKEHRDFDAYIVEEVVLETNIKHPQVSFDGEVCRLMSPLYYKVIPQAITVISPFSDSNI